MTDIDREVAEKVMGWEVLEEKADKIAYATVRRDYTKNGADVCGSIMRFFTPSTDISDAWLVVERMLSFDTGGAGWEFYLHNDTAWCCGFIRPDAQGGEVDKIESAPLAICLAALKALA